MVVSQRLQKWGNGTGIRLPKKVVDSLGLSLQQELEIRLDGASIILTPVKMPLSAPRLEELLKAITPENVHTPVSWGASVGRELW